MQNKKTKPTSEEKEAIKKERTWWSNFISSMKKKGALISDETATQLRQQQLFK